MNTTTAFELDIDEFGSEVISVYYWTEGMKKAKRLEIDRDDFFVFLLATHKMTWVMDYSDSYGEHEQHQGNYSEDEYISEVGEKMQKEDLKEYITIKQLIKL